MDNVPLGQQPIPKPDSEEQIKQEPAVQPMHEPAPRNVPAAVEDDGANKIETGLRAKDQSVAGWKPVDLDFIAPSTVPAPPFPIEVLPARVGELITGFSAQRRLQLDFVAGAVIGGFAAAIGNRARLLGFDGEAEPVAMFVALAGPPGTGKSKALNIAGKPLNRIDAAMIAAYEATTASKDGYSLSVLASALKETVARRLLLEGRSGTGDEQDDEIGPPPGLVLTETTAAGLLDELEEGCDGRVVLNHELTSVLTLGSSAGGLKTRAILLQAYDGEPYKKRTKTSGRAVVPALHISILGATQPDRIALLTGKARDGLVPRFLWYVPDATPTAEMAVGSGDIQAFEDALVRLIRIEPAQDADGYSRRIMLLDEARSPLETASERWIEAQRKADGAMQDVLGRARQQALRLATVLALAEHALAGNDGAIPSIGAADVQRGIELMDRYFIGMAERAIGYAGAPQASGALRLALYLRRLGKATVSVRDDIYRGPGSPVRKADAVAVALEELRQRGFIRDAARGGSVGRPGLMVEVHPELIDG